MIGALVFLLASVIPAIFIAERIRKRRRRARWMRGRSAIPDDQFYALLGSVPVSRGAAVRLRLEVGHATRLPADLIGPSDPVRELEAVGEGSHPAIIDHFTDLLFVKEPKNESDLLTVRDLVIEFGPQLESLVSGRLTGLT
jgi:hypothetical protein